MTIKKFRRWPGFKTPRSTCSIRFKVAVASAAGRKHEADGILCQDAVCGVTSRKLAVIVLADGAGSARYARLGAQIAVNTTARMLVNSFRRFMKAGLKTVQHRLMSKLLKTLSVAARRQNADNRDFACTLLFAATDGKQLLMGQLGDGRVGVCRGDTDSRKAGAQTWQPALAAAKGEFFNETVFITSANAANRLQLALIPVEAGDACIILSDGAEEGLYQRASQTFAPAVSRMLEWVHQYDRNTVETALENNLRDVVRLKTADDVSVGFVIC